MILVISDFHSDYQTFIRFVRFYQTFNNWPSLDMTLFIKNSKIHIPIFVDNNKLLLIDFEIFILMHIE